MRHGFTFKGLLLGTLLLSTAQISFAEFDDLAIFEMTKAAQTGLIRKGYEIGKPDGSCGPATAAAVRAYLAPILAEQQLEPIPSEEDACQRISKAYGELEAEYDGDLAKQLGFRTATVTAYPVRSGMHNIWCHLGHGLSLQSAMIVASVPRFWE